MKSDDRYELRLERCVQPFVVQGKTLVEMGIDICWMRLKDQKNTNGIETVTSQKSPDSSIVAGILRLLCYFRSLNAFNVVGSNSLVSSLSVVVVMAETASELALL